MANLINKLSTCRPWVLSLLRIVAALLFLEHGTQKLFGFPTPSYSPAMFTLPWIAGVMEVVGGALLIVGAFTRPVAFLLSGLMAAAYWMAHAPKNFFPVLNGGDGAILFCFIFLYLVFAGAGPLSVDAWKARQAREAI